MFRLSILTLVGLTLPVTAAPWGDIDKSGSVTILDSLAAAQHAVGLITIRGCCFRLGNVNGMGDIDVLDSLLIAQASAGLSVMFRCNDRDWEPIALSCPTAPSPRQTESGVFAPVRNEAVIFGGTFVDTSGQDAYDDTWAWDGACWTEITITGSRPPGRGQHQLAYDPTRQTVLLFGGIEVGGCNLNGLWELSGNSWLQLTPLPGQPTPSGRGRPAVAYDPIQGELVVFGGSRSSGCGGHQLYAETWVWSSSSELWALVPSSGLPATQRASMCFDEARGQIVLFGGQTNSVNWLNDTYLWDSATRSWSAPTLMGNPPPGRNDSAMAFDPCLGEVVLFGGNGMSNTTLNDLWKFDGTRWEQIVTANRPPPRRTHAMFFDPNLKGIVIQGGVDSGSAPGATFYDDTWIYH